MQEELPMLLFENKGKKRSLGIYVTKTKVNWLLKKGMHLTDQDRGQKSWGSKSSNDYF